MTDLHLRAVVDDRGVDIEFAIGAGEVLAVLVPTARARPRRCTLSRPGAARQRRGATRGSCAHRHVGRRVRSHPRPTRRPASSGAAAVSTPECGGQCGVRAAQRASQAAPPSGSRDRRALAGPGRGRRSRRPDATTAVRRTGSAGGSGARTGRRPDVLLLDEPLAGLDVATATAMRKLLRNTLNRDGRSRC